MAQTLRNMESCRPTKTRLAVRPTMARVLLPTQAAKKRWRPTDHSQRQRGTQSSARRPSVSEVSAFRLGIGVLDIPANDEDRQCVEYRAAVCEHNAFLPDRNSEVIDEWDSIRSGGVSYTDTDSSEMDVFTNGHNIPLIRIHRIDRLINAY